MTCLFITGASGFISTHLLQKLDATKYNHVYCLSRNANKLNPGLHANVQFIQGGVYDSESYAPYLRLSETVIHLAAATGKASREECFKVNTQGVSFFIEQCRQAAVKNFLYVSTIAVKYPDKSRYYYAQSKQAAEKLVRDSRLNYLIVRPTIVIGKDGVIWKTLSRLGRMPVVVIPGDGSAKTQPIYIDDLVKCLLTTLSEDDFSNETFELGGPEQISFDNLLQRIHFLYYGRSPLTIHVPLEPLGTCLAFFESRLPFLPVTAGQLSAFSNDGTIEENRIYRRHSSQMKIVDEMLGQVIANG